MAAQMTIEQVYENFKKLGLSGWLDFEECKVIKQEIDNMPVNGTYTEIGVAYGKSFAIASYYAKPEVKLFGIDRLNWKQPREDLLKEFGVLDRGTFIEGESQQEALLWKHGEIDLLFIDGDHSYYGLVRDFLSWLPHVKHGGRVMIHDYVIREPGVMRAFHQFILNHPAYKDFELKRSIYTFTKV